MQFVGTVSKGLFCAACSKPWNPEAATQCSSCEAVVCTACVPSSNSDATPAPCCPACKKEGVSYVAVPKLVRQLAENAKMFCANKDHGCDWTGTRTEHKAHLCKAASPSYNYVEESSIPQELQCPLCHTPFIDPVQLQQCEHVFCRTCIVASLGLTQECPCDRQPVRDPSQIVAAPKLIQDMLSELPVLCTHHNAASSKCDWCGPRSHLGKHLTQEGECKHHEAAPHPSTASGNSSSGGSSRMEVEGITEYQSIEAADAAQTVYAMAHLTAPRLLSLTDRKKPLSISAVIDVSGSMSGGKLKMAQESLKFMIDELTDRDELGIIAFHTTIAETICLTKMDEAGKQRCRHAADSLRALNRTNLSGGLFAGMDQVQHLSFTAGGGVPENRVPRRCSSMPSMPSGLAKLPFPPHHVLPAYADHPDTCRTVLLFTDGIANGGISNEDQLKETLQGKLKHPGTKDMIIHTFGFGADHNARLLQGMAEIASGSYYYIQDVATMKESFADCLGGLMSTVAQNIHLTIKTCRGFEVDKVLTSLKQETKNGATTVSMKDVYSCEKRDIVVKIKLGSALAVSKTAIDMVQFTVQYDSLLSGTSETVTTHCKILPAATKDSGEPNVKLMEQRTRIEATEAMQAAKERADAGDAAGAQLFMRKSRAALKKKCKESSFVDEMLDDMAEVEETMNDQEEWMCQGSKQMAQVQSCHAQQRMNRPSESKAKLGYDNEWKAEMRGKSRK